MEKRTIFGPDETAYAVLTLLFAYALSRLFPVSARPLTALIVMGALYAATAVMLVRKKAVFGRVSLTAFFCGAGFLLSMPVHDNLFLHGIAYVAAWICYIFFVYSASGNSLEEGFSNLLPVDVLRSQISPFINFTSLFRALFGSRRFGRTLARVLAGILLGILPALLAFKLLSFDEGFLEILRGLTRFGSVTSHLLSAAIAVPGGMWLFGMYVSGTDRRCPTFLTAQRCRNLTGKLRILSPLTMAAAVLPVLILYGVFFVSQWRYYTSGFLGVLPGSLTYAEYARSGFFELIAVAMMNLLLYGCLSLFGKRQGSQIVLRLLRALLALTTLILLASAAARLVLYVRAYGLTPSRVLAAFWMAFLALGFLASLIGQAVPRIRQIPVWTAIAIILALILSFCDPDAHIARYNVDRYLDGSLPVMDLDLLEGLGDAAVPQVARLAQVLEPEEGDMERYAASLTESGTAFLDAKFGTQEDLYGRAVLWLCRQTMLRKDDLSRVNLSRRRADQILRELNFPGIAPR